MRRRIRTNLANRIVLRVWAAFLVIVAAAAASEADTAPEAVVTAVLFLGIAVVCLRGASRMGVEAGDHGIVVRGLMRTRRVPWEEIDSFELVSGLYGRKWATEGVAHLKNGRRLLLALSKRQRDAIDFLNAELARRRGPAPA